MSYLPTAGATEVASTALDAAKAALKVAEDPHLPELICNVLRLSAIEEGRDPGRPCGRLSISAAKGRGIGLRYAVVPVRLAVKVRERPIISVAVAGGILFGLVALGYALGRRARSKPREVASA